MKKTISFLLIATILFSICAINVSAASTVHTFTLSQSAAEVGDKTVVTVTVAVDNTEKIQGVQYNLNFDKDAFEIDETINETIFEDYEEEYPNFINYNWFEKEYNLKNTKKLYQSVGSFWTVLVGSTNNYLVVQGARAKGITSANAEDNKIIGKFDFILKADATAGDKVFSVSGATTIDESENFGATPACAPITYTVASSAPTTYDVTPKDVVDGVTTNVTTIVKNAGETVTEADPVFSAEAVFWNTNEYTEFIAENTDCLGIDLKLKNISEQEQSIQPYIALYENNILCEAKVCSLQTFEAGEEISYAEEFMVDANKTESYTVKVFNWNDNLNPMTNAVSINAVKNDFFGNSIDSASTITTEKNIRGKINSSEDIDYIKFTPALCDYYDIESADNINITLLNSNNQLVEKELNNKYYLDKELYYLKISSETATEYLINIDRYAERIENLTVTINEETNLITLSGTVSSADERLLTVTVYNPENVCEQIDTIETSVTGAFTYSYKTPELLNGSYQAVINNYEIASQGWLTFDSGTSSKYIDKNTYRNEKLTLIKSQATVMIDGVENSTAIVAGKDVVANVSVFNESELAQNVSAVLVFYDENNSMIDYMSISKEISPNATETFTPTITLPTDKTTSKIKVLVLNGNGIYDKTNSVISNVLEVSNGKIIRYEFEEITDEPLSATSTISLVNVPFSHNELKQIKENLTTTLNNYQPMATSDYEPWGTEFNQSGEKLNVDVTVSTNDIFYEKYLTKTGAENYYLTIKNKQSKPVYAIYYINTIYESSPGKYVGIADDRYFHIYVERIEANRTKEINIEIPSNELFNEYGEYGHQLGFGVADISFTWDEIDWLDVSVVNLYPSHRNSFGNSLDNDYRVVSNTSNNAVFEGKLIIVVM